MDKKQILIDYKNKEDKNCIAQVLDKIEMSKKNNKIENSDFLDMYQISLIENFLRKIKFENYILYGGFENAERKVLIITPEKYDMKMIEKNYDKILKILKIELDELDYGKFQHRNYLGGIVKVGIKREKVGDIIVDKNGADIIVLNQTAEILKNELQTLKRFEKSKFEISKIADLRKQEIKLEDLSIIVPSLRLDNIVSDLAKTSRNKAVQIIAQERVFINGKNETKVSKQIKIKDVITIRGKGRFEIKEITGTTRSGRSVLLVSHWGRFLMRHFCRTWDRGIVFCYICEL